MIASISSRDLFGPSALRRSRTILAVSPGLTRSDGVWAHFDRLDVDFRGKQADCYVKGVNV